jgi:hypothetical protein
VEELQALFHLSVVRVLRAGDKQLLAVALLSERRLRSGLCLNGSAVVGQVV